MMYQIVMGTFSSDVPYSLLHFCCKFVDMPLSRSSGRHHSQLVLVSFIQQSHSLYIARAL